MAEVSLLGVGGVCGVRPPLSVLDDIMVYGAYRSTSLRTVLDTMKTDCTADPDAAGALIAITGSADITSVQPDVSGLLNTIDLKLALTNLSPQPVEIESAELIVTDSGGASLGKSPLWGPGTVLPNLVPPLPSGSVHSGERIFTWGGGVFNIVISIQAYVQGGARHHLLRRIPIRRAGFANPPNVALPSPVFVGLWNRPVEVVRLMHHGADTQWLTVAGVIVSRARLAVGTTLDVLAFRLESELGTLDDRIVPNWFFRFSDGKLAPPNPDGRVPMTEMGYRFVVGYPVGLAGKRLTLRIDLRYTMTTAGKSVQGKAVSAVPVVEVGPDKLTPPLHSPASGNWNWGNAPDHETFADPNGSPTGFDAHANPGEHYCYDLTVHADVSGQDKTFVGSCLDAPGGKHTGDCTNNASFFDYGQPVFAARSGTVVLAEDGHAENFGFDANPATGIGNFVVVDHGDNTMAGYFHLKSGSLTVSTKSGKNMVVAGAHIADVGNSGSSSEPHLHLGFVRLDKHGRMVNAPVVFAGLTLLDGTPMNVVPGNGLYRS